MVWGGYPAGYSISMADKSIDLCPTFYQEDVAVVAPGTVLVARPCMLWTIICVLETTGTVVLNISDDSGGYTAAHRVGKIVFSGPNTEWDGFGKGFNFTRGISVQCNIPSVDVWGVFE